MTKYTRVQHKQDERRWAIHPIWRGIGCIMIIIIVVMAYALAKEAVDYNQRTQKLGLPNFIYKLVYIQYTKYIPALKKDDVVNKLLAHVKYGYLIFGAIFLFLLLGIYSFIYSAIYRATGPARYSPIDSPEVKKPPKMRRGRY